MRIKIPNSKVKELLILENTLRFDDEEKYAKADHLTDEEVARCRKFGFVIDGARAIPQGEPQGEPIPLIEEPDLFQDSKPKKIEEPAPVEAPKVQKAQKPNSKANIRKGGRK